MKSIKELRKNNKKGFTLVELIVVLVILAILAALLIPTLTGYIDKAKEKDVIAQTRQAVMAAQTLVDEQYGKSAVASGVYVEGNSNDNVTNQASIVEIKKADITKLAEVSGTIKEIRVTSDGKVTGLVYTNKGKNCVYDQTATDNYTVPKTDADATLPKK